MPNHPASPRPQLEEVSPQQLEQVSGGYTEGVITEECPTCLSGVDPTVGQAQFQLALSKDL